MRERGFTLIELLMVMAIIGLLTAIGVPKVADLTDKAKIAALKGQLGALRGALKIYYTDNRNRMPDLSVSHDLATVLVPKYIPEIPRVAWPRAYLANTSVLVPHPANGHRLTSACAEVNLGFGFNDPYCYRDFSGPPSRGSPAQLALTCTDHTDFTGRHFSRY